MKRWPIVLLFGLLLTGCSGGGVGNWADNAATRTPTATVTPTPTPTPKALSIEEAGKYYLAAVYPANAAITANDNAFAQQDLASIKSTAATARDQLRSETVAFSNPMVVWPADVADEMKVLSASNFKAIALLDALSSAASLDQANATSNSYVPDNSSASAQHVRLVLNLPADTSAGC